MREFVNLLGARLDDIDHDRGSSGSPLIEYAPLTAGDCIPGGMDSDLTSKIIVIKSGVLSPEYRTLSHTLYVAIGGFGTSPTARGRAVFATNVYSGESSRFDRADILGVVSPERIPKWAINSMR